MARTPHGILGALQGKIGPVTGYIRNGKAILRVAHSRPDGKITPARTAQREKIKLTNSFTKAFTGTGFFSRTFPSAEAKGTGYNRATAAIMSTAIKGDHPNTCLSYPHILISQGTLPPPESATVKKDRKGNLIFTWLPNTRTRGAKASDKAVLVAFFPQLGTATFTIGTAIRKDGTATLPATAPKGTLLQTWLAFLSSEESAASNSLHTGSLTL